MTELRVNNETRNRGLSLGVGAVPRACAPSRARPDCASAASPSAVAAPRSPPASNDTIESGIIPTRKLNQVLDPRVRTLDDLESSEVRAGSVALFRTTLRRPNIGYWKLETRDTSLKIETRKSARLAGTGVRRRVAHARQETRILSFEMCACVWGPPLSKLSLSLSLSPSLSNRRHRRRRRRRRRGKNTFFGVSSRKDHTVQ